MPPKPPMPLAVPQSDQLGAIGPCVPAGAGIPMPIPPDIPTVPGMAMPLGALMPMPPDRPMAGGGVPMVGVPGMRSVAGPGI